MEKMLVVSTRRENTYVVLHAKAKKLKVRVDFDLLSEIADQVIASRAQNAMQTMSIEGHC